MATLGSLAIGSKIKIPHSVLGDIIFLKADKDHDGYPSNSTTLITEKIILLRAFDAKEPNNSDSSRKSYGNNKYSVSNLDQWLNSSAAAGQWYSARHSADQAPNSTSNVSRNPYDTDAGFLAGFDAAFVAALKDTTLKVALNTVTDGGSYESVTRKFFLPSRAELFGTAENSIMEGSLLSYFSANTNAVRIAQLSAYAAQDNTNKGSSSVTAGSNWYYWLRTPLSSDSYSVRYVHSDGSLNSGHAYYGFRGVRPLCNLDSGISVSDSTDSDGCYTLNLDTGLSAPEISVSNPIYCQPTQETGGIEGGTAEITWTEVGNATSYILERSVNNGAFAQIYSGTARSYTENVLNTYQSLQYRVKSVNAEEESDYATSPVYVVQDNYPPFISGDESNLGEKPTRFSYNYIIYDGDDAKITVKEYLNTTLLRTYQASAGQTQTFEITSAQWGAISVGDNYIKIVVSDEAASVSQTKHFTKSAGVLELEYTPTGNITVQPKAINVELDLIKPFAADLQVLACNNGNDTQPVWDDITTAVRANINHVFTNVAKQAGVTYWKVILKIVVNRNGTEGDIKLGGIKCTLDATVE